MFAEPDLVSHCATPVLSCLVCLGQSIEVWQCFQSRLTSVIIYLNFHFRLAIALEVLESAILAHNSNEMSDYLEPFYRCEAKFSKNNEVRRRPLPKLNEATAIPEIKSTKRRLIETTPVTTTTTTISTTTTKRTRKFGEVFFNYDV